MRVNGRSGIALLEVLAALTILSVTGLALTQVLRQSLQAQSAARTAETELLNADRVLSAVSLLTGPELDRRLGQHAIGEFQVEVQRPERGLYRLAVLGDSGRQLLVTVVHKPGERQ